MLVSPAVAAEITPASASEWSFAEGRRRLSQYLRTQFGDLRLVQLDIAFAVQGAVRSQPKMDGLPMTRIKVRIVQHLKGERASPPPGSALRLERK